MGASTNTNGQRPIPPFDNQIANDFEHLTTFTTSVCSNLDVVRKHIRYHVDQPNLLKDLKIDEIRKQLDEIEARATTRDTSEPHKNVKPLDAVPEPEVSLVDTNEGVAALVDTIVEVQQQSLSDCPILFIDSEGVNLGRHGTLSLLQIYLPYKDQVYIIDIQVLMSQAFDTAGKINEHETLRFLLEAPLVHKALWDCRADIDALYSHYNIELAGVIDIQLADNATSKKFSSRSRLVSLTTAIEKRINLPKLKLWAMSELKSIGRVAMEKGIDCIENCMTQVGSEEAGYRWICRVDVDCTHGKDGKEVLSGVARRPLHPMMIQYCAQDVVALPMLYDRCNRSKLWTSKWVERVDIESQARVQKSKSPRFKPNGAGKNFPPKGWKAIDRVLEGEEETAKEDVVDGEEEEEPEEQPPSKEQAKQEFGEQTEEIDNEENGGEQYGVQDEDQIRKSGEKAAEQDQED